MRTIILGLAAGGMLLVAPACAQEDPVKAGVEAYERGDYKAAVDRWRGPANQGNADAQFNIGQAYKLGRGVPVDLKLAEDWYRKAALQGHEQAEANYGLALFENGKRGDAVQWLQRAVARGDARAQYILGIMLFNGDKIEKDWVRAYALMTRASQTGLDAASKALAQMDQYMPLDTRQQGSALARKYEQQANSGGAPLPPVEVVSTPTPQPSRPVPRPTPPRPAAPVVADDPAPLRDRPAARPAPAAPRDGGWRLQLGAFGDPANARKLWSQLGGRFPGRQVSYVKAGTLTKVLVGPYASRAEAAAGCRGVSPCVPVTR